MAVITDDFNRPDSAAINPASDGGAWTTDGSRWSIYGDRAYANSAAPGDTALDWVSTLTAARRDTGKVATEMTAINYRQSSGNPTWGLLFSANPATGYAYALYTSSSSFVNLGGAIGGSIVSGPGSSPSISDWSGGTATFEIQHDGAGHITVLMNGSTILTWDDSASTAFLAQLGTWVGVMGHPFNDPTSRFGFDTWDYFTATIKPPPLPALPDESHVAEVRSEVRLQPRLHIPREHA